MYHKDRYSNLKEYLNIKDSNVFLLQHFKDVSCLVNGNKAVALDSDPHEDGLLSSISTYVPLTENYDLNLAPTGNEILRFIP